MFDKYNYLILVSGMPGTGKTTFAKWLSSEFRIPLVCYDNIKEKSLMLARESCENEEQMNNLWRFPLGFFFFFAEEIMKSSSSFIAETFFANKMNDELNNLMEKYRYTTITVHMDASFETAHRRFLDRNKNIPSVEGMRPMTIPFDKFVEGVRQNKEFRYGEHYIHVDTEDFSKVLYNDIAVNIRRYLI